MSIIRSITDTLGITKKDVGPTVVESSYIRNLNGTNREVELITINYIPPEMKFSNIHPASDNSGSDNMDHDNIHIITSFPDNSSHLGMIRELYGLKNKLNHKIAEFYCSLGEVYVNYDNFFSAGACFITESDKINVDNINTNDLSDVFKKFDLLETRTDKVDSALQQFFTYTGSHHIERNYFGNMIADSSIAIKAGGEDTPGIPEGVTRVNLAIYPSLCSVMGNNEIRNYAHNILDAALRYLEK